MISDDVSNDSHEFLIVALGASAGGLEPLETFFRNVPSGSGMAFVVIQHLSPDHESALSQLLGRHTRMPVEQATDGTVVAPNRVYVIPPNANLTIRDGALNVTPPTAARGARTPIDSFFSSLAEDVGQYAVCIMLSGTGSDGTLGLRAIKEHGGMGMAQSLDSAKYDSILQSAIATGLVDHVLPAAEMPAKLADHAAHVATVNGESSDFGKQLDGQLATIHELLRKRVGHDFSHYKQTTIARRLERRMKALQIETAEEYVELLKAQPEEADRLFNDLLIGVTHFFRDADSFKALEREVIPKLFEDNKSGSAIRACVVGCATGEEAYSLAILLCEHAGTLPEPPKIQIFATDIDERSLESARKGQYSKQIAEHLSPARLKRFFTQDDNGYQVKREIREICLFSLHSFIKDPPFSRLDLISCRNVMIYLGHDLQRKVVPLFHYALRTGGFLFLGPSESTTSHRELFRTVDKKHRIFERKDVLPRPAVVFPVTEVIRPAHSGAKRGELNDPNFPKHLERIILQRYRPACVTVKENGDAVYFSGRTAAYLEHPTGQPDVNVVNLAREGLRAPLRTALHRAVSTGERTDQKQIPIQHNGGMRYVDLTVEPLADFQPAHLYMIVFEDAAPTSPPAGFVPLADSNAEESIRHLEDELRSSQEQAQTMYEELESSNEELKSANEEFQSTNEELETSKEELQSFNEELQTVNSELGRKATELDRVNSDLRNLLNSTQIATIFLDRELGIRNFTPSAADVFRLIPGDVGRPITDLAAHFAGLDLQADTTGVLTTLQTRERQLNGANGRHYQMRILPYSSVSGAVDGVVLTFTDVTQMKEAEQAATDAKVLAESVIESVRDPMLVLDGNARVKSANLAFYHHFGARPGEAANTPLDEIAGGQWNIPELRRLLSELLADEGEFKQFEMEAVFPPMGLRILLLNAHRIPQQDGNEPLILLTIADITERKETERALVKVNTELQYFSYAASHDLQEPLRMVMSYTQLLAKTYKGKLDPLADHFIDTAVDGAKRMEALLRDLRDYWSAAEENGARLSSVDTGSALLKALANLEAPVGESGAVVTHDPLPAVVAEEYPLIVLFQNLVGNAIKYCRTDAPPRVHVSASRNGAEWTITVSDNGVGIEDSQRESVFAPFKRLHGTEFRSGTGLGLAICRKIVERFHGRIWVDSAEEGGSEFHFTVPGVGESK